MMMAVGTASGGRARPARAVEIPPKACSLRSDLLIFVGACPFSGCSAVRTMTRVAAASRFATPRPERFASPTRTTGTAAKEKKDADDKAKREAARNRGFQGHPSLFQGSHGNRYYRMYSNNQQPESWQQWCWLATGDGRVVEATSTQQDDTNTTWHNYRLTGGSGASIQANNINWNAYLQSTNNGHYDHIECHW